MKLDLPFFSPENTFLNGQCFRWNRHEEGFKGIVKKKELYLIKNEDGLEIQGVEEADKEWLLHYLGVEEDLQEKEKIIASIDPVMEAAITHGKGMHLLRQEPFETLISFILSANNHIPRIKSLVEKLALHYGEKIGVDAYAFPTPEELSRATLEELRTLGLGYRDKYVLDAARKVSSGEIDLDKIYALNSADGSKELQKIMGVGKKVAYCILLFCYGKRDNFPVDTWIKQALGLYYPEKMKEFPTAEAFFSGYFGEDAGLAQQYLFHYMRTKGNSP